MDNVSGTAEPDAATSDTDFSFVSTPYEVLDHVRKLTEELERIWSNALIGEEFDCARTDYIRLWTTFANSLSTTSSWINKYDLTLSATAEEYPLSDERIASLDLNPTDPLLRYRQLQIGVVEATIEFVNALGDLNEPTSHRVTLNSDGTSTLESWWSSSAFETVLGTSRSLEILMIQQDACLAEILSSYGEEAAKPFRRLSSQQPWSHYLICARKLRQMGAASLSLTPLLHSLRSAVAHMSGCSYSSLPERISIFLRRIDGMGDLASLVDILETCAQRLAVGKEVEEGAAYILSGRIESLILRQISDPPPSSAWHELRGSQDDK